MSTYVRRTALQPTAGYSAPENKKTENQTLNKTKLIAGGAILGLAIATAAYCGSGYIFPKTPQPDHMTRACDLNFIVESSHIRKCPDGSCISSDDKLFSHLPGSPEFSKAYSDHLTSAPYKQCISSQQKEVKDLFTKFCATEAYKTHWACV
jgi:hypothetical protein